MSLVTFAYDSVSVSPICIYKEEIELEGIKRPALKFVFNTDGLGLKDLSDMFSKENCKQITITEDDGSQFVYDNYSVRIKLANELETVKDEEGNFSTQEFINITMGKRTELELQYEELTASLEETQLALLEIYETQEV